MILMYAQPQSCGCHLVVIHAAGLMKVLGNVAASTIHECIHFTAP